MYEILVSFFLLVCPSEKFRVSRRSCEIERAGNANFATAGSTGKKKRRERKGPETTPWPVSITRLLWLRQWRTLFLAAQDVLSASFPPAVLLSYSRRSATASETAQREHRRSRLNGFLASPGPPPSLRFPHSSLLLFYSSSSVFLSSSLQSLDVQIYSAVTSRSRMSPWTMFESASLFNFIISVASISRPYLHLAARLICHFNVNRTFCVHFCE